MLKALQIKTFGEAVIWAENTKRSKSENEKILDCEILNTENEKPLISHIILQNALAFYMPTFCGDEFHYKTGYIHLRFYESPAQTNNLCDKPPPF